MRSYRYYLEAALNAGRRAPGCADLSVSYRGARMIRGLERRIFPVFRASPDPGLSAEILPTMLELIMKNLPVGNHSVLLEVQVSGLVLEIHEC